MTYTTELLNPMWWVNNLIGDVFLLVVLLEIWLLSFVRKIPNVKMISILLIGVNSLIMIYAIFVTEGITIGQSLLGVMILIFGIIAWSSFNNS